MKILSTQRLDIEPFTLKDAPFVIALLNSAGWINNIGDRNVKTLKAAEDYIIEKYLFGYKNDGFGAYKVKLKDTDITIGTTGLFRREGLGGVDVGFAFLPKYEGFGYAYEATKAVMDYELKRHNFTEILAITLPTNQRSIKLLERLGLTFQKYIQLPNDKENLMLFSVDL